MSCRRMQKVFVMSRHSRHKLIDGLRRLKVHNGSVFLHAQSSHLPLTIPICCNFQFAKIDRDHKKVLL